MKQTEWIEIVPVSRCYSIRQLDKEGKVLSNKNFNFLFNETENNWIMGDVYTPDEDDLRECLEILEMLNK